MKIKCNKCGYIGEESEFPEGRDFFQSLYIARCANSECDNRQSSGNASMRMMSGIEHPFEYVREHLPAISDPLDIVLFNASEAS